MSGSGQPAVLQSLWRYPVKSMAGEELAASEVTVRGLLGDRGYALVDTSNRMVVSAKNPRKWPGLFDYRAAYLVEPEAGAALPAVRITLPGGGTVTGVGPDTDAVLSGALGRAVQLKAAEQVGELTGRASVEAYWPDLAGLAHRDGVTEFELPDGTFFDSAVLHLLTTATLARLGELNPQGRPPTRRFRPNLVVDLGEQAAGFVENDWVGRTLQVGQVQLAVTRPCARCVMITLPQGDLPKDSGLLRTVAERNNANVGVLASVLRPGRVHLGDPVTML